MPTLPLPFKRPAMRIIERITRDQVAQLIIAHPTAEAMAREARLAYYPQSRWWQTGKPVHVALYIDEVPNDHLYHIKNTCLTDRHEISVTVNPRLPPEYRNAFYLYGLGLALERMNSRKGHAWGMIGSQLDPDASQAGFDMMVLSEGKRALTELPWTRAAA